MPKKKTALSEIAKIEDWKAPWEVKKDPEDPTKTVDVPEDEQEIDKKQLKTWAYGLLTDKLRIRDSLDETTAAKEELEQKVAEADDPDKVKNLQAEIEKQNAELEKAKGDTTAVRLRIALRHGLTERQAERLVGKNEEELEEDAEVLLAEWGGKGKTSEEEGGGGSPRTAPRSPVRTQGDPQEEPPPKDNDPDPAKVAADWLANR